VTPPRAADDFPMIRARMQELRRERARPRAADDFSPIRARVEKLGRERAQALAEARGPFGDPPEALSSCREYETEPEGRHQRPRLITHSAESSSMMVSIRQIHPA
jgi:hypothetical protein